MPWTRSVQPLENARPAVDRSKKLQGSYPHRTVHQTVAPVRGACDGTCMLRSHDRVAPQSTPDCSSARSSRAARCSAGESRAGRGPSICSPNCSTCARVEWC
ncbi:hypothetical protein [Ornithinimicrobium kibberense]|uniref:hypothetical protein n=1 Tax=Ornithinimicrobium kibberense TaxID=282060 RepID=UPI00361A4A8B